MAQDANGKLSTITCTCQWRTSDLIKSSTISGRARKEYCIGNRFIMITVADEAAHINCEHLIMINLSL